MIALVRRLCWQCYTCSCHLVLSVKGQICSHNLHLRPCFNSFYFSKKVVCCVLTHVISLLIPAKVTEVSCVVQSHILSKRIESFHLQSSQEDGRKPFRTWMGTVLVGLCAPPNMWLELGAPGSVCVCIAQFCLWDIRKIPGIWPPT